MVLTLRQIRLEALTKALTNALKAHRRVISSRNQKSGGGLVGAHLRVRPKSGQTRRSAPTAASF
jgi:hypothetical protein